MRRAALSLLLLAAAPAAAQTADRYGYAPPDAQVPMRQAWTSPARQAAAPPLRPTVAAASTVREPAAPPLRLLSWPGKGAAAPQAQPAVAAATPAAVAPRLRATPAPAPIRATWTPRPRWAAAAAARAPLGGASAPPVIASAPLEGVGPEPHRTVLEPPGVLARAPVAPPPAVTAAAPAQGAAAMGPPQNPWYQRWPQSEAAPDPAVAQGVGASLAPGTPTAPPVAQPTAYAAPPSAPPVARTVASAPSRGTARYYSVHTAYGHAPDPAPIPPQFFGPTADLSAPETPEPARATLTANATSAKAAVNAARLQQEDAQ